MLLTVRRYDHIPVQLAIWKNAKALSGKPPIGRRGVHLCLHLESANHVLGCLFDSARHDENMISGLYLFANIGHAGAKRTGISVEVRIFEVFTSLRVVSRRSDKDVALHGGLQIRSRWRSASETCA